MKKLSPPSVTGITIDEKIQLDDTFAGIVDTINQWIKQYYPTGVFNYKPNTNDNTGLSVLVEMVNEWKQNYKWVVDQVNKTTKNLNYDLDKNLLSLKKTEEAKTTTSTTDTTKTSSTDTSDSSSTSSSSGSYADPNTYKEVAYGGIAKTIASKGQSAIEGLREEVKRIKKLMTL